MFFFFPLYSEIDEAFACYVNDVAAQCGSRPYDFYVREITRAGLRAMRATTGRRFTLHPYNCNLHIPEEVYYFIHNNNKYITNNYAIIHSPKIIFSFNETESLWVIFKKLFYFNTNYDRCS